MVRETVQQAGREEFLRVRFEGLRTDKCSRIIKYRLMFEEFIMIPGGGVKIASCERQQARQMICRRDLNLKTWQNSLV